MSPSLTLSLPSLAVPSCTFKLSTMSGFIFPPLRSWLRSCVSFSMAFSICDSSPERSKASSVGVMAPELLTGGVPSVLAWALFALPAFLWSDALMEKSRVVCDGYCHTDGRRRGL